MLFLLKHTLLKFFDFPKQLGLDFFVLLALLQKEFPLHRKLVFTKFYLLEVADADILKEVSQALKILLLEAFCVVFTGLLIVLAFFEIVEIVK